MNNFSYYYLPVLPNNKLSTLLSVIDSIPLSEKIIVLTKKAQQNAELSEFLKTKGISNVALNTQSEVESLVVAPNNQIYIIAEDLIPVAKSICATYVVSLFASNVVEKCKEKAAICFLQEKQIVIELISKFDYQFIQTLYKFPEITVQRFSLLENSEMIVNKNSRIADYVSYYLNNVELLNKTLELPENIANLFNSLSLDALKSFFIKFFALTMYGKVPTFDSPFESAKGNKEFKLVFQKGYLDDVNEIALKEYLSKIENFKLENIIYLQVEEKKTVIVINSKELTKDNITDYITKNKYNNETYLEVDSLVERSLEEKSENTSDYRNNRDNSSYRGDRNRSQSFSGGGYQRRDSSSRYSSSKSESSDSSSGGDRYSKPSFGGGRDRSSAGGERRYGRSSEGYRGNSGGGSGFGDRKRSFNNEGSTGGSGYYNKRSNYRSDNSNAAGSSESSPIEGAGYQKDRGFGSSSSSSYGDKRRSYYGNNDDRSSSYRGGSSDSKFGNNGGYQKKPYQKDGFSRYSKDRDYSSDKGERNYSKPKSSGPRTDSMIDYDLE